MESWIPTGSLGLDLMLRGGWERGHIHEIWGTPGSGKTTLAEHAASEMTELYKPYAMTLWVSLGSPPPARSDVLVAQPRNAEQAFSVMTGAARQGTGLIVVDTANGLVRQAELDGDPDYKPHPQREYRDELTALKRACKASGTTALFLSKPRDKDREPVRGTGISEKAASRVNLRVQHTYQDGAKDIVAEVRGELILVKFTIVPGTGIDWATELARTAMRFFVVKQRASWLEHGGKRYHGLNDFVTAIRDSPSLAAALEKEIWAKARSA